MKKLFKPIDDVYDGIDRVMEFTKELINNKKDSK